jgi:hypothetical protein
MAILSFQRLLRLLPQSGEGLAHLVSVLHRNRFILTMPSTMVCAEIMPRWMFLLLASYRFVQVQNTERVLVFFLPHSSLNDCVVCLCIWHRACLEWAYNIQLVAVKHPEVTALNPTLWRIR